MGIPESLLKATLEVGFIALFTIGVTQRLRSRQPIRGAVLILPVGLAILIGVASGAMQHTSVMENLFYVRLLVLPLLFLLGVLNVTLDEAAARRLLLLIAGLILAQIPFFAYKWLTIGVEEKHWIGALSQTAGQLGLIFPMLALCVLIPQYLFAGGWPIILIMIYSCLPVVNEKRAVIIMIPALFAIATITYTKFSLPRLSCTTRRPHIHLRRLALLVGVCLTVWMASVASIPSLKCMKGTSCLSQVTRYFYEYSLRDFSSPMNISRTSKEENTNIQLGRLTLITESALLLSEKGWNTLLFGVGGGAINPSPNLGPDRADIMFKKFGLRGTYSYGLMLLWEGGIVSVIATAGIFALLWLALVRRLAEVQTNSSIIFGSVTILMVAVLAFDFFGYSTAGWLTHSVTPFIFTLCAVFIKHGYPAKAD